MAALVFAAATTFISADAQAEKFHVLTAGGTSTLQGLQVTTSFDGETHLTPGPHTELQLTDGGLATYTDLVVLPGGHLLLADGSGRGAVRFDADGQQVEQLFSPGEWTAPPSVVAAGFITPNDPDLLLMPDGSNGHLRIYDKIADNFLWNHDPRLEERLPLIARAIISPEDKVSAAFNWPPLSLAAVQVLSRDNSEETQLIIASEAHPELPDALIIDDLYPLRDLMGDLDGRLLITSRTGLFIVDPTGDLLWHMDLGDDAAMGGEFEAARWLDSGLVVAATRQPGLWTEPHSNHRIHLIDPDADNPVIDSSASLDAAPVALETAAGHGGTGTRDYSADAFDFDEAPPSALDVDEGPTVDPSELLLDESTTLRFLLSNRDEAPVTIRRAEFRVAQGGCDELEPADELDHSWWSSHQNRTIDIEDSWDSGDLSMAADELDADIWCGRLVMTGRDGVSHILGEPVEVEIGPPSGSDGPVSVEELAEFDPIDAGITDDTGNGITPADNGSGCSCSSTSPASSLPLVVLLAIFLIGRFRRLPVPNPG